MSKTGYTQLPSGFWTKDSDASSPYIYDGSNMILLTTQSGGSAVDVLDTVVTKFNENGEKPKDGDTLQVTLDKLKTSDSAVELMLGKMQAQINALEAEIESLKG